jgi:hypothetical protein
MASYLYYLRKLVLQNITHLSQMSDDGPSGKMTVSSFA